MAIQLDPVTIDRMDRFNRRRLRMVAQRVLCSVIVGLVLGMSVVAVTDWYFVLIDAARWAMSVSVYGAVGILAWFAGVRQLVFSPSTQHLARMIESSDPELREQLLSAVELATSSETVADSEQFREMLQHEVAGKIGQMQLSSALPANLLRRWFAGAIGLVACAAILLSLPESPFPDLVTRAFLPGANIARISRTKITILAPTPASTLVPQGEPIVILAEVSGTPEDTAILEWRVGNEPFERVDMNQKGETQFAVNVNIADQPITYRVLAGDAITQRFTIESRPRPYVQSFVKTYEYPAYTQLEETTIEQQTGDLSALQGTTVDVIFHLDQPVTEARIRISRPASDEIETIHATVLESNQISAAIEIGAGGIYQVHLVGADTGFENAFSPKYEINSLVDLAPRADWIGQQERTLLLPPNDILQMVGQVEDDLPLSDVEQRIRVNDGEWQSVPFALDAARSVRVERSWDLLDLQLESGDLVTTKLVATDRKGNEGESIPLSIVVTTTDFRPDRHAVLELKAASYDVVHELADDIDEALHKVMEIVREAKEPEINSTQLQLHFANLLELAESSERASRQAIEHLVLTLAKMPAGPDAHELELIAQCLVPIPLTEMRKPKSFIASAKRARDERELAAELAKVEAAFGFSTGHVRVLERAFQKLLTYNVSLAFGEDLQTIRTHQEEVAARGEMTRERLLRQQRVTTNLMRLVCDFATDHMRHIDGSFEGTLRSKIHRLEWMGGRLEEAMGNDKDPNQLKSVFHASLAEIRNHVTAPIPGNMSSLGSSARKQIHEINRSRAESIRKLAQALKNRDHSAAELAKDETPARVWIAENATASLEIATLSIELPKADATFSDASPLGNTMLASDARLVRRAVPVVLNSRTVSAPGAEPNTTADSALETTLDIPLVLQQIGDAYATLESGHRIENLLQLLTELVNQERWESQSKIGQFALPRYWHTLQPRLAEEGKQLDKAGQSVKPLTSIPVTAIWIWNSGPVKKKIELRKSFKLETIPESALMMATCDNAFTMKVNGAKVASSKVWTKPVYRDIAQFLCKGENSIEIEAEMFGGSAGFICQLNLLNASRSLIVATDKTWESREPKGQWRAVAELKPHGASPWGSLLAPKSDSLERVLTGFPKEFGQHLTRLAWSPSARLIADNMRLRRTNNPSYSNVTVQLQELHAELTTLVNQMQPAMVEARELIAQYLKSIAEIAKQASEDAEALEAETEALAEAATEQDLAETQEDISELQAAEDALREQLAELFDALLDEANNQSLLNEEGIERARDADDAMAMLQDLAQKLEQTIDDAAEADTEQAQSEALSKAAQEQDQAAETLEQIAEHFRKLENGEDVSESRETLREAEAMLAREEQFDERFAPAERLAEMAQSSIEDLLKELEAELEVNPEMQTALSEISQQAVREAQKTLTENEQEERDVRRDLDQADTERRDQKKPLDDELRQLTAETRRLAQQLQQSESNAAQARAPDAQKQLGLSREQTKQVSDALTVEQQRNKTPLLEELAEQTQELAKSLSEAAGRIEDAKPMLAEAKAKNLTEDEAVRKRELDALNREMSLQHSRDLRTAQNNQKQAETRLRNAERQVTNEKRKLAQEKNRLKQAQDRQKRDPDNRGLQNVTRLAEQRVATLEKGVERQEQEVIEPRAAATEAKANTAEVAANKPQPLKAANPRAEMAERQATQQAKEAAQLAERAKELAKAIEKTMPNALQATEQQLATAEESQQEIGEQVQQAADTLARAGRHEERLGNDQAGEVLAERVEATEAVAQGEVSDAAKKLAEAAVPGTEPNQPATDAPPVGSQDAAAQAVAQAESAIGEQADQLGEMLAAAEATGEGQPNGEGQADGEGQSQGEDSAPATAPGATAKGQQLAETLDELDQAMAAAAGTPQDASALSSLAQAAQREAAALAQARQQQSATLSPMATPAPPSLVSAVAELPPGAALGGTDPAVGPMVRVNRLEAEDWGKLPPKVAKDLTEGSRESVSSEYRNQIETYFRVIAERAGKKNND